MRHHLRFTNNNPVLSITSAGTTTITGQTNINTTGSAGIELGTGGAGPGVLGTQRVIRLLRVA